MSTSIKVGHVIHIWNRVLTAAEVKAAHEFLTRGEPIPNCDCNVCTGKVMVDSWWTQTAPIVGFQATPGWVFDGMTVSVGDVSIGTEVEKIEDEQ